MFERQSIVMYGVVLFYLHMPCTVEQYDFYKYNKDFHKAFIYL